MTQDAIIKQVSYTRFYHLVDRKRKFKVLAANLGRDER